MIAGDETALAKRLGVPVPAVVDWLLGNRPHVEAVSEFLEQVRRRQGY
jgi:DNA-binding transcriptional regulator YdaS (Cro superfamily)